MKKEVRRRPREKFTQEQVDNFVLEEEYPKGKKFKDLTGSKFGKWTVLKYAGKEGKTQPKYFCKCSCEEGTIQKVLGHHLRNGVSTSCGCEQKIKASEARSKTEDEYINQLKSYKEAWELINYDKSCSLFTGFCPACNTTFNISSTSIYLKSGGCKCTMLSHNGFDYDKPAWFYIFKLTDTQGNLHWKYGVTQKENVESRNHGLYNEIKRDLVFSEIISTRYETIRIEQKFKSFLEERGCSNTGSYLMRNGHTECYERGIVSLRDLVNLFWELEPSVVPFRTENLSDVTVIDTNPLRKGIKNTFNLNHNQMVKLLSKISEDGYSHSDIDLTNRHHFNYIKDIVVSSIN